MVEEALVAVLDLCLVTDSEVGSGLMAAIAPATPAGAVVARVSGLSQGAPVSTTPAPAPGLGREVQVGTSPTTSSSSGSAEGEVQASARRSLGLPAVVPGGAPVSRGAPHSEDDMVAVLEDVAPGRGPHWAAAHPAPVVLLVARLQAAEGALQALSAPCAAALARCRAHWLDAQVDDVQEAAMDLGVRRVPCLFAMRADGPTSAFDVKDWAGATQFAVAGLPALPQGTVPEVPEVLEVPEVVEASHGTPSTQASGAGPVQVPGASGGAVVVSTPYGYQQVSAPSASVPVPVPVPAPVRPGEVEVEVEVVVVKKAEEEVEEAVAGAAGRGWGPAGPFPWAFVETHGAAPEHSCPVVLVPESSSLLRKLTLVTQRKWLVLA